MKCVVKVIARTKREVINWMHLHLNVLHLFLWISELSVRIYQKYIWYQIDMILSKLSIEHIMIFMPSSVLSQNSSDNVNNGFDLIAHSLNINLWKKGCFNKAQRIFSQALFVKSIGTYLLTKISLANALDIKKFPSLLIVGKLMDFIQVLSCCFYFYF